MLTCIGAYALICLQSLVLPNCHLLGSPLTTIGAVIIIHQQLATTISAIIIILEQLAACAAKHGV